MIEENTHWETGGDIAQAREWEKEHRGRLHELRELGRTRRSHEDIQEIRLHARTGLQLLRNIRSNHGFVSADLHTVMAELKHLTTRPGELQGRTGAFALLNRLLQTIRDVPRGKQIRRSGIVTAGPTLNQHNIVVSHEGAPESTLRDVVRVDADNFVHPFTLDDYVVELQTGNSSKLVTIREDDGTMYPIKASFILARSPKTLHCQRLALAPNSIEELTSTIAFIIDNLCWRMNTADEIEHVEFRELEEGPTGTINIVGETIRKLVPETHSNCDRVLAGTSGRLRVLRALSDRKYEEVACAELSDPRWGANAY